MYKLPKSATEALRMVAENKFTPFDRTDWETFSGCESEDPLICYLENPDNEDGDASGVAIILDGTTVYFQTLNHIDDTHWKNFSLVGGNLLPVAERVLHWLVDTYGMPPSHYLAKGLQEAIAEVKREVPNQ